jgi:hypothetical protein
VGGRRIGHSDIEPRGEGHALVLVLHLYKKYEITRDEINETHI